LINNNILGLIGLAMKAGKIAFGADSVEESILKRKVKLVIVSEESSERTKSKFIKLCQNYNIPIIIDGNIDDLSKTIGKSNKAVIGIKDINFANSIQKKYDGGDIIG
jgi:ribosomal protein L7Ae-like RNA K-turn-binding protein